MPRSLADIDRELIAVSHKYHQAERHGDLEEMDAQETALDELLDERHSLFLVWNEQQSKAAGLS